MQITTPNLQALRTGFDNRFQAGLDQADSQYTQVAMTVPSTAASNTYGWLGQVPNMREWIGERHVHGLQEHDYMIKNRDWEQTVGVDRNAILDDTYGVYNPIFEEFGRAVAANPDQLVFGAYANGWDNECYDGQNFFDTDHPVTGEDGSETTVSNSGGGSSSQPWFLIDDSRAIKPVIHQLRQAANFVAMDNPTDPNVFRNKEFHYGTDGRWNVGYGFWQMAYGSQQTLTAANYEAAGVALSEMRGDHGRKLGLRGKLLIVPTALEGAALDILSVDREAGGGTNKWRGTAKLLLADWL